MSRLYLGLALLVVVTSGIATYGHSRYNAGVRSATAEFLRADLEGAENVKTIASELLALIGDDPDVDELLRETGGLRHDAGSVHATECNAPNRGDFGLETDSAGSGHPS